MWRMQMCKQCLAVDEGQGMSCSRELIPFADLKSQVQRLRKKQVRRCSHSFDQAVVVHLSRSHLHGPWPIAKGALIITMGV